MGNINLGDLKKKTIDVQKKNMEVKYEDKKFAQQNGVFGNKSSRPMPLPKGNAPVNR